MSLTPPPVRLRLPATSANLGPGFDALGLALGFALHVEAAASTEFQIEAAGRDAERIRDPETSLILRTYRDVVQQQAGGPPLQLTLRNEIPLGMGCGSSAAALVAGVALANHFGSLKWTRDQVLTEASRREGHPDNVAACMLGGLTASSMTVDASGRTRVTAVSTPVQANWSFLLAIPGQSLSTEKARALLPDTYSSADAVANVQAVAMLTLAFALGRGDLLGIAMRDRMHQPYRTVAAPLLPALLSLQGQHGILGVALSGAGPSVLLVLEESAVMTRVEAEVNTQLVSMGTQAELVHTYAGTSAVMSTWDYPMITI